MNGGSKGLVYSTMPIRRPIVLALAAGLLLIVATLAAAKPWTTRQSVSRYRTLVANDFPGADLGEKINAADRALGASSGEVLVKGGGIISTQVIINSGHTLRFSPGTYVLKTNLLWEGAFLLKSATRVVGSGWDTIIIEPPKTGWIVFQSFADIRSRPVHSGTDSGISVSDLQIKGANPNVEGGVRQTVSLGNCHRCTVENLWLNGTGVIGVQAGGISTTGNHATDVIIRKNRFTRVASQAIAVVNGSYVKIDGNTFEASGRCCAQGMTAIDLEPNDPADIMRNIEIKNNSIDSTNSGFIHGNGILVQNSVRTRQFGPVLVEKNTIIGGKLLPNTAGFIATGIYIAGFTENVRVIDNIVTRVAHSGIRLENSTRNQVSGNRLISTGTGGILPFEVIDTTDSQIFDNVVVVDPRSSLGTEAIQESGKSARNSYQRNSGSKGLLLPATVRARP